MAVTPEVVYVAAVPTVPKSQPIFLPKHDFENLDQISFSSLLIPSPPYPQKHTHH